MQKSITEFFRDRKGAVGKGDLSHPLGLLPLNSLSRLGVSTLGRKVRLFFKVLHGIIFIHTSELC